MGCGTSLGKTAPVPRNASRGRTIRYHNVVPGFEKLGVWTGEPLELPPAGTAPPCRCSAAATA